VQFEVVSEEAKTTASYNGKQPLQVCSIGPPLSFHISTSLLATQYSRFENESLSEKFETSNLGLDAFLCYSVSNFEQSVPSRLAF